MLKIKTGNASEFAHDELARYCELVFRDFREIDGKIELSVFESGSDGDRIKIDVKGGSGVISGNNQCALLIAVYRFLQECGCRFLRPGKLGEYLPSLLLSEVCVSVDECADSKIRCMIIEGACSFENVLDMVDFCPKIGLNHYQLQFKNAGAFFERYYRHERNPLRSSENPSPEFIAEGIKRIRAEIKKRGMALETMGHGWAVYPIGIEMDSWEQYSGSLDDKTKSYLALVDGKRELIDGAPFRTNLCYSNPEVVEKMVDYMIEYCRENPEVDLVHFALSDKINTQCECERCGGRRTSDHVVKILNRMDERMTEEGFNQKIGVCAYLDTIWPPLEEKLNNLDRFVFGIYPALHLYRDAIDPESIRAEEKYPFELNKNVRVRDFAAVLSYMKSWQEAIPGAKFVIGEYHFMWEHCADFGYHMISRILSRDIKTHKALGIDGMLSYQPQRCSVPTGLGLYTYGHTLWNHGADFDGLCEDYYRHAFGDCWQVAMELCDKLSSALDMKLWHYECEMDELAEALRASLEVIGEYRPRLAEFTKPTLPIWETSLSDLVLYVDYIAEYIAALLLLFSGEIEKAEEEMRALLEKAWALEDKIGDRWDLFIMLGYHSVWFSGFADKMRKRGEDEFNENLV